MPVLTVTTLVVAAARWPSCPRGRLSNVLPIRSPPARPLSFHDKPVGSEVGAARTLIQFREKTVGLLIDPNPASVGFVRTRPGAPPGAVPLIGSDLDVNLGNGWSYRADD